MFIINCANDYYHYAKQQVSDKMCSSVSPLLTWQETQQEGTRAQNEAKTDFHPDFRRVRGQRQRRAAQQTGGESVESESASAAPEREEGRHTVTDRRRTALQKNLQETSCHKTRVKLGSGAT